MKNILLIVLTFLLFSCKKDVEKTSDLVDFIPNNPAVIIQSESISSLQNTLLENELLQEFKNTKIFKKLKLDFEFLNAIESDQEVLISYATVGKNLQYLMAIKVKNTVSNFVLSEKLYEYNGKKYQQLKGKNAFSFRLDSVLVVASSEILLENLIRNKKDNLKYANAGLMKLLKTNAAKTSFFMNAENLPNFIKPLFPTQFLDSKEWLSLVVKAENGMQINGIAISDQVKHSFVNKIKDSKIDESEVATVLPETVTSYTAFNFEELKDTSSQFEHFEELLSITTELVQFTIGGEDLCAFKLIDSDILGNLQSEQVYRNVAIYKNKYYKIPATFSKGQPGYACFLGDFMLCSKTILGLQNCIAHYQNETTLSKQHYYQQHEKVLLNESHIVNGTKTTLWLNQLATVLEDKTIVKVKLTDYPFLSHQIIYEDGHIQFNSVLQKVVKTKKAKGVSQVASIILKGDVSGKPQWVLNHKNKQKEIVVQDKNNVLYLISNSGKIIWEKQLKSKIQGGIQQVDLFKNRKLQLAFTTDNEFMILDRNGKIVDSFYKQFPDGGLLPLSVFDYEKSRNYRFIITQNEKLFMYDNKMKAIKGFKFKKANSKVLSAPIHVRLGAKDYIVFAEENGKLQILNRQGEERTKVKSNFDFKSNALNVVKNNIIFKDAKNQIQQVNIASGVVKKIDILQGEAPSFISKNNLKVKLEGNNLSFNTKTIELEYGTYTTPVIAFGNNSYYINVTDIDTQKVYVYNSKGDLLKKFPVYGQSQIALTNMDADRNLEFAVQGESNSILIYKMK